MGIQSNISTAVKNFTYAIKHPRIAIGTLFVRLAKSLPAGLGRASQSFGNFVAGYKDKPLSERTMEGFAFHRQEAVQEKAQAYAEEVQGKIKGLADQPLPAEIKARMAMELPLNELVLLADYGGQNKKAVQLVLGKLLDNLTVYYYSKKVKRYEDSPTYEKEKRGNKRDYKDNKALIKIFLDPRCPEIPENLRKISNDNKRKHEKYIKRAFKDSPDFDLSHFFMKAAKATREFFEKETNVGVLNKLKELLKSSDVKPRHGFVKHEALRVIDQTIKNRSAGN